jgi:hypothetical protein
MADFFELFPSLLPYCVYSRKDSYLPAAHSEEESHDIGLLLLVKLLDIFEGTHLGYRQRLDRRVDLSLVP